MLVHSLEDRYIESIGHAFGYYDYGEEKGLASAFKDRDRTAVYICGFARAMLQAGLLSATSPCYEGFIAYKLPGQKIRPSAFLPLFQGVFRSMTLAELLRFARAMKQGGRCATNTTSGKRRIFLSACSAFRRHTSIRATCESS